MKTKRWILVDSVPFVEIQADVEQKGPYVLAHAFPVEDAVWLTEIDDAKRWCETVLELPVCEDA